MTRIAPLEPPYEDTIARRLESMMPPGVPPIALFRTFAKNEPMTEAMGRWGRYELGRELSLTMRDREIVIDRLLALGLATGKTDFAFHRAIAVATNNPFYVEVLDALGARTIPCDVTSPWGTDSVLTREYEEGLQREHLAILKAISASDPQAARDAMRAHLAASQERYRRRLRGQQDEYLAGAGKVRIG